MKIIPQEFGLGTKMIVDTSFLGVHEKGERMLRRLYRGLSGLDSVSLEEIEQRIERLNLIKTDFASLDYCTVLPVITEIERGIEATKNHTKFAEKGNRMNNPMFEVRVRKIDALWRLIGSTGDVKQMLRAHLVDFRTDSVYNEYFEAAKRVYSFFEKEEEEKARRSNRNRANTLCFETDPKIIASAYIMAKNGKVVILSRDKNMRKVTQRLADEIRAENWVSVYNPDACYSCKERVRYR